MTKGASVRRVRVKICGITTRADAIAAVDCGADALGFNLYPGSKRYLDFESNAGWIASLPGFVARVAVLVNPTMDQALRIAGHPAIDMVQFHGDEDEGFCRAFAASGWPFIKALRLGADSSLKIGERFSTPHVLVDAHVPGAYGGTGTAIDLALASRCVELNPELQIILAGGLTPGNVGAAVAAARPYAVDVASGVELAPGRKDPERMVGFVAEASGRDGVKE